MLKKTLLSAALISASLAMADTNHVISNDDNREALSITIYNESLALINETRNIPFQKGLNNVELKGVSAQIRAETALLTSLSKMPFSVIEQNFDYDLLSPHALLEKAVGQEIEIIKTNPKTGEEMRETATLLSNNGQPVLKFKDRIEIGNFNQFAFKSIPEGLRDRPTLSVLLNSEKAVDNKIQLAYLTGGFSWKADYTATLSADEKSLDLSGLITLNNNSGTNFKNAQLQLVAGDINQVRQQNYRGAEANLVMMAKSAPMMDTAATTEQFGDYHLYKIPFATDLNNNQTKQVALLSAQNVPVQKEYIFDQYFSYTTQDGQNLKASVQYRLDNKKENHLGMPLPKGIFRMYKNDSSGNALLVGEDRISHTAENEEFIVKTGDAFDVSLVKTLKDQKTISKNVHQFTYEVTFNNAKDEAVSVNYNSLIGEVDWQILKTSQQNVKSESSDVAKWIVKVPAKEKATLTYTLQISNK